MKSLLKLLGTLALATTPVVAVVACDSKNNQMTSMDILNSAASFITNSNLQVKADLNLPDDTDIGKMKGNIFSELDASVQTAIGDFFSSKLKKNTNEHPTNWYHPDAHVKIMNYVPKNDNVDEKDKPKFILPTGSELVNGHLWVKAEISYLNLPSVTKDIKITINNDTNNSSDQKKTDAIKDFIKEEITKGNLNVNVENLPISGEIKSPEQDKKAEIARTQLSYIQQNLNVAIKDKVQYYGLSLSFAFSGDFSSVNKSTLFTMTTPTVNNNDNKSIIFNGNINNITIGFLVGNDGRNYLDTGALNKNVPTIKINQTFVDATTQISKIFSELTVDPVKELPKASEKYLNYKEKASIEDQVIKNGYFANINKIYSILNSKWNYTVITITNPESQFNLNPNGKNGYFNLNFKLEYDLKGILSSTDSKFNINVENIHIKLREIKN